MVIRTFDEPSAEGLVCPRLNNVTDPELSNSKLNDWGTQLAGLELRLVEPSWASSRPPAFLPVVGVADEKGVILGNDTFSFFYFIYLHL